MNYEEKTHPLTIVSAKKKPLTWVIPKLNPSLRDKKPVGSLYHGHIYR
jgi:hypothetical protein